MIYAEASYFDGFHFQHIAAYEERRSRERRRKEQLRLIERRIRDRRR